MSDRPPADSPPGDPAKTAKPRDPAAKDTPPRRRKRGLEALSASLPMVTRKLFGKRGFAEGGLVREWSAIVGAELAAITMPQGLSYPRRDRRTNGQLTLRVASGHALTVQHLEPILIERVNGYFGCAKVARLKLQQGPLTSRPARHPRPAPALTAKGESDLQSRTKAVEDEALRGALERLGREVLARREARSKPKAGS